MGGHVGKCTPNRQWDKGKTMGNPWKVPSAVRAEGGDRG